MSKQLLTRGFQLGVLSLSTGKIDSTLQAAAQSHADYQARAESMGHQDWDNRWRALAGIMPHASGFREVAAYTWGHQELAQVAAAIFNSWRASTPHWKSVNGRCSFYGYALAQSPKGVWYACGIFADEKNA